MQQSRPILYTFEVNAFRMDESSGKPIVGFNRLFIDFELAIKRFMRVGKSGPVLRGPLDLGGGNGHSADRLEAWSVS